MIKIIPRFEMRNPDSRHAEAELVNSCPGLSMSTVWKKKWQGVVGVGGWGGGGRPRRFPLKIIPPVPKRGRGGGVTLTPTVLKLNHFSTISQSLAVFGHLWELWVGVN